MELRPASAEEIAVRSRGVPRIANRLLKRVRDVTDSPTPKQTVKIMAELGVDSWGMDEGDRTLLMLLYRRFQGGPVGAEAVRAVSLPTITLRGIAAGRVPTFVLWSNMVTLLCCWTLVAY